MSQNGQDNQVELRRTVDRATAPTCRSTPWTCAASRRMVPGGDATQASTRGTPRSPARRRESSSTVSPRSQDTLSTMAEDTGGRAFFDSNAFGQVFDRVVADTSAYYVLGFSSTNPARDGRFRRIKVRVKRADVKLEYRSGYYAPRDFAHSTKDDREQQLQDQLPSDLSSTDFARTCRPRISVSATTDITCRSRCRCLVIRCRSRGPRQE